LRYFLDTSSLVKIYHKESGTADVLNIYNKAENLIQISELGRIEFLSTVHRKYKSLRINSKAPRPLALAIPKIWVRSIKFFGWERVRRRMWDKIGWRKLEEAEFRDRYPLLGRF
jgi:predicted nucleic acid-binding protein